MGKTIDAEEFLRKWHNKEYGYDGDGVVNPAVITVG